MNEQLKIPLFPPDMMQKIKTAHHLMEMEKLRKEIEHLKHQRAGHIGAYQKLKNKDDGKRENTKGDC